MDNALKYTPDVTRFGQPLTDNLAYTVTDKTGHQTTVTLTYDYPTYSTSGVPVIYNNSGPADQPFRHIQQGTSYNKYYAGSAWFSGDDGRQGGAGKSLVMNNSLDISTTGAGSPGIDAQSLGGDGGWGGDGKTVTVRNESDICTFGDNSYGILAQSVGGGGGKGGFAIAATASDTFSLSLSFGGSGGIGGISGPMKVYDTAGGFSVAGGISGGLCLNFSMAGTGGEGGEATRFPCRPAATSPRKARIRTPSSHRAWAATGAMADSPGPGIRSWFHGVQGAGAVPSLNPADGNIIKIVGCDWKWRPAGKNGEVLSWGRFAEPDGFLFLPSSWQGGWACWGPSGEWPKQA